jgi:predicted AlkP superfamily phosphohydrolase/phosphomutase
LIGLDGLEPDIVSGLLDLGQLPNLARLRELGGFSRVSTTTPAQTPVAWSTFATGTNPGGHGIFDFIGRNPKTYLPDLALNRYEQKNAFLPPKAVNLRRGTPVWDLLAAAGRASTVLRCPCTYPADSANGRMLSGMGVPDLRGGLGTTTFYTTDPAAQARESENLVRLQPRPNAKIAAHVIGPRNPKAAGDSLRLDFFIRPDVAARRVIIQFDGSREELEVREGQWSEWIRLKFKLGLLQSVRGMMRFHLVRLEPQLEMHASPVNFDPDLPLFPISAPAHFAGDLAWKIGLYHTTGMVEDHTGLNNERISEDAFLDQCETAWQEREAMLLHELERFQDGLFYCLFDTPDRVQHMFWRYRDTDHPANRGEVPSSRYSQVIADCYRRCDAIVGKALEFADDQTLFIALSDHGFNGFRRGVNLNTWLYENGLLSLREGVRPGDEAGDFLRNVDWGRTKAYALGLSGVYLNLAGREERGIVTRDEAEATKALIAAGLTNLLDRERGGQPAIRSVKSRESVYTGPYVEEAPDLLVNFSPGYRVSWSSSMGGLSEGQIEDNVKKWSGDHIIDPELVPGVLLMNRPFQQKNARLVDLAPTILTALGTSKGSAMEGESLLR